MSFFTRPVKSRRMFSFWISNRHKPDPCRAASGSVAKHSKTESKIRAVALAWLCLVAPCLAAQNTVPDLKTNALQTCQMPCLDTMPDPLEGFNRCSWAVNVWLFRGIIYPASCGYNFVVPGCVRTNINNA